MSSIDPNSSVVVSSYDPNSIMDSRGSNTLYASYANKAAQNFKDQVEKAIPYLKRRLEKNPSKSRERNLEAAIRKAHDLEAKWRSMVALARMGGGSDSNVHLGFEEQVNRASKALELFENEQPKSSPGNPQKPAEPKQPQTQTPDKTHSKAA